MNEYAHEVKKRLLAGNADLRRGIMFDQGECGFDFTTDMLGGLRGKVVSAMPKLKVIGIGIVCGVMMVIGFVSLMALGGAL